MNRDQVKGNWKQVKGRVRERWGKLTDDDLDVAAGQRDQLRGQDTGTLRIEKDKAQQEVDAYFERHMF